MLAGARVEVAPYKKNPMDFVLWKPSTEEQPGWDSPWGRGRPGWHIECSAMSEALLGETFDIHGGGIDLVFPHHENEIAQSEGAHHGHPLAKVWMHNGFLQVEGEKMSKSLGNFFTIRDLLADWPGEVLRLNMLRTHYRQPIDFTIAGLKESWKMLERWYEVTEPLADPAPDAAFFEALSDDLNTPAAIASLHQAEPLALAGGLGFLGFSNVQLRIASKAQVDTVAIADAIAARNAARKARDFKESDRIRDDQAGGAQRRQRPVAGAGVGCRGGCDMPGGQDQRLPGQSGAGDFAGRKSRQYRPLDGSHCRTQARAFVRRGAFFRRLQVRSKLCAVLHHDGLSGRRQVDRAL